MTRISSWWPWALIVAGIIAIGWAGTQIGAHVTAGAGAGAAPTPTLDWKPTAEAIGRMLEATPEPACAPYTVDLSTGRSAISIQARSTVVTEEKVMDGRVYVVETNNADVPAYEIDGDPVRIIPILSPGGRDLWDQQGALELLYVPPGTWRVFSLVFLDAQHVALFPPDPPGNVVLLVCPVS